MTKLHNAWFRHSDSDAVIVLIYEARPITDLRTYGNREVSEAEKIALDSQKILNAILCSIIEVS